MSSTKETRERNILVGILAENHEISSLIGDAFGKKGQKTDLQFYDRYDNRLNAVFCAIDAIAYPDKIKSLIHTMMLTKYHVLVIDNQQGITPAIGEIMVLLDIYKRDFNTIPILAIANITPSNEYNLEIVEQKVKQFIQTLSIKDSKIIEIRDKEDREKLKDYIFSTDKENPDTEEKDSAENTIVNIDHSFPVKGIGTVVLGLVKSGVVEAGKMLNLVNSEGVNRKLIIRSIQKQDRDFKTAEVGDRVGLAIKGIKPEEIQRGDLLTAPNLFEIKSKLKIKLKRTLFYKENVSPDSTRQFHVFIGLATAPMQVSGGDSIPPGGDGVIEITTQRPVPIDKSGSKGIIAELNKFENKLRIVGSFKVL